MNEGSSSLVGSLPRIFLLILIFLGKATEAVIELQIMSMLKEHFFTGKISIFLFRFYLCNGDGHAFWTYRRD